MVIPGVSYQQPDRLGTVLSRLLFHHHQVVDITRFADAPILNTGFYRAVGFMKMHAIVIPAMFACPENFREKMKEFIPFNIYGSESPDTGRIYDPDP